MMHRLTMFGIDDEGYCPNPLHFKLVENLTTSHHITRYVLRLVQVLSGRCAQSLLFCQLFFRTVAVISMKLRNREQSNNVRIHFWNMFIFLKILLMEIRVARSNSNLERGGE